MPTWKQLVSDVQAWVDKRSQHYLQRLTGPNRTRQFSILNDGVWGSIRLTSLERAVIDSPVFQRLRHIRQLGPATLVYPSASHSRFDHSLGALHRATTVMDALALASRDKVPTSLLAPEAELDEW